MNIKERIEKNVAIFFISAMVIGFSSGFGAYKIILNLSKLDTVQKGSYVLKEKFSSFFIEWDDSKRQYVIRHTDEILLEAISPDNIIQLERIGAKIRKLTYQQYKLLRSQMLDQLIQKQAPVIIEDVLKNAQSELNIKVEPKSLSPLLISLGSEILSNIFMKREEVLSNINKEERAALNKLKLLGSHWVPPSYKNLANLNLKERQLELVITQFDISRIQVRDFVEIKWTPVFLEKVSRNEEMLRDLRKAQDDKQRLAIFVDLFSEIFNQVNKRYESLVSEISTQQNIMFDRIDLQFIELISEKIDTSKFDRAINTELIQSLEKIDTSLDAIRDYTQ